MNIHDFVQGIKRSGSQAEDIEFNLEGEVVHHPLLNRLYLAIIIILISSLSFGIGRLSVASNREGVRIDYDPEISNSQLPAANLIQRPDTQTANAVQAITGQEVVGSKNGSKYHYEHCPGAKQIKEENRVVFASPAAAESAGYSLAANCRQR